MTFLRAVAAIALLGFIAAVRLGSQPNPDRLFLRVQTPIRPQPSPTAPQSAVLRPGTLLTAVADTSQSGGFVRVNQDNGEPGWVLATSVRPLAVLEAEQALEPFGGLESVRPMDSNLPTTGRL